MDRSANLVGPPRRDVGQVIEWLVWAAIACYSPRATHLFLPLDDRGVDGIARRLDDEAMCAIQVKGRTSLYHSELRVMVRRSALDDRNVTFVVALLHPDTASLDSTVYVLDASRVLELGVHTSDSGTPVVRLDIPYPNKQGSRWAPFACGLAELPDRLLPALTAPLAGRQAMPAPPIHQDLIGHLGELEVLRLLGEGPELNTFKAFPDMEVAEYLIRQRTTGYIRGVQVKCIEIDDANGHGEINLHGASFFPSPVTDIVVLTYRRDLAGFDDHSWVIPAVDIPALKPPSRSGQILITLHPAGVRDSRFDPYRVRRPELAAHFAQRLARE